MINKIMWLRNHTIMYAGRSTPGAKTLAVDRDSSIMPKNREENRCFLKGHGKKRMRGMCPSDLGGSLPLHIKELGRPLTENWTDNGGSFCVENGTEI